MDILPDGGKYRIYANNRASQKVLDFDWSGSRIGMMDYWPQSLVFHLNRILEAGFPMVLWWGTEYIQFSNDACQKLAEKMQMFAGLDKVGISGEDACPHLWPLIKNKIDLVYSLARPIYAENEPVFLRNVPNGMNMHWTNSFDPIRDENGQILGVVASFKEANHLFRSLRETRKEQSFLLELNDMLAGEEGPDKKAISSLSAIGNLLNIDCLGFGVPLDGAGSFEIAHCFSNDNVPGKDSLPTFFEFGKKEYAKLKKGRSVVIDDCATGELVNSDSKVSPEHDHRARLAIPIMQQGVLVAVFFAYRCSGNTWQKGELALLKQAAVRIWDSLLIAKATIQLTDSELRYRTLFESLDEGFMVIDFIFDNHGIPYDYRFVQLNSAFERQSGLKCQVGKTILDIMPDIEPHWIKKYGAVATSRKAIRFQDYNHSTERWYEVYATPMENTKTQVVVVFKDISERKREEKRKEDFLNIASHELKTPITSLNGYLFMLKRLADSDDNIVMQGLLDKAFAQIKKMLRLINSFLSISQFNSGDILLNKEHFDLAWLLKKLMNDFIDQCKTHKFKYEIPSTLMLHGDSDKISQVVENLLNNATKYSPLESIIKLSCTLKEGVVNIVVQDQGIGLAKDEFEKIFQRFYRTETDKTETISGFGIGLYLCKKIIEQHGGSIGVTTDEDSGTSFWFTLPLTA